MDCAAGTVDEDGNAATGCTACAGGKYLGASTIVTGLSFPGGSDLRTLTVNGATDAVAGQKFRITTAAGAQGTCATTTDAGAAEVQVQSVGPHNGATSTLTMTQELIGADTAQHCMLSAIECTACELGTADEDADPSTPCVECTLGQYASGAGTGCTDCPAGKYDHDTGGDNTISVFSMDLDSNQIVIAHSGVFYYGSGDKLQLAHANGATCAAAPLPPAGDLVIDTVVHSCVSSDAGTTCTLREQVMNIPVAGSCERAEGSGTCSYRTTITFVTDLTAADTALFSSDDCALVLPAEERSPCIECEVGKYASYSGTVYRCFACAAGRRASDASGEFVLSGASQCVQCAAGQYDDDSNGGTECKDCAGGTASAAGQVACTTCNAGQFSGIAAATCDNCAAGKYDADGSAATECVDCDAGRYSVPGKAVCTACAAGKYAGPSASFCAVCVVNTYDHDDDPGTVCESCPAGTNSGGETGLTQTPGCVENVCAPFADSTVLRLLGYEASETSVATRPQDFGTLGCYSATHWLSDLAVEPYAICVEAGAQMVLSGCERRCTPFESADQIRQLGYTAASPTAVTVGSMGEIGCNADTHVLTDDLVPASATCAGLPAPVAFSGCSPRAQCSTMRGAGHECPDSYHLNNDTLTSLCVSSTCDSTIDRDTCCSANTCEAREPGTGYTVGSTTGVTIVELQPIACAVGYMGTRSHPTFIDNNPSTPAVTCSKETNSNAGVGAFAYSGCEPSACSVVAEDALRQRGYAVSNQRDLTDYATVAELGDIACAAGYRNTSDVVPSVSCEWDGELPVADFVFVGCEEITCAAPDVGPLVDATGDETRARSRYTIVQSGTQGSGLGIECAPEFVGAPSAICEVAGGGFTYSGCAWRTCAAPGSVAGYTIANAENGTRGDRFVRGVNFECAPGFQGYAAFAGCTTDGGEFAFSGCTVTPDKTSGAAGGGGRWVAVALLPMLLAGAHRALLL
jgi:hypothetical protein